MDRWRAFAAIALVALLFAASAAAAPQVERDRASAKPVPRVLVYTVSAGFVHDVVKRETPDKPSIVEQALIDLGRDTGDFEAVLSRDASDFTRENLAKFSLVFFYTTGELPFSPEQTSALFDFVKHGGAFAGAHCATDTFYKVPEYGAMIGAYFDGHPWHEKVRIKVEDREHPATKHLGESFEITDEIYQFKAPYDRAKLHVLLSLDTSALDLKKDGIHRADHDFANAWCKEYGKGRVFYTALGHGPEVWKDERFLKHIDGGFRWAMKLDRDASSSSAPAVKKPEKKSPSEGDDKKGGGADKKQDEPQDAAVGASSSKLADARVSAHHESSSPLPIVPPGFAIDLIAQAPEILWPSVVHALSDGSILVGEDRIDMPGPTNQPLDRIIHIAFKPDGTIEKKVFADRLFAVFGMEEIDGDVYVMNMPHLTRLRDKDGDGIADERKEILTDLGPPAPGQPGGFNDHIVSGIRLAMDGFLYVAVGDKGIPLAHGTDGSTITLRGGGVVRVRPDGSRLQIVARGLRNILDVAIDARGEMFTYDNTDDGLGWWTRFTHVVAGGYYGYPWDYHDHQERMLPCMKDYGGGSPCGGLVYREAAWPEEFQGSLFFCEWGKGALRRFEVELDRSSFQVKKDEDFVRAGDVKSFRPLNVRESPDGRFLYMTDWGFDGWTQPDPAGRLWRIRRSSDDAREPSVARPLPSSIADLVGALADPSFNHRLRAERELIRRGPEALDALRASYADESTPPRARVHALWALALIRPPDIVDLLRAGLAMRPIELRTQVVRAIALSDAWSSELLGHAFAEPAPRMKREVFGAIALAGDDVAAKLEKPLEALFASANPQFGTLPGRADPFLHFGLMSALRRAKYVPDLAASKERTQALEILRDRYEPEVVHELERFVANAAIGVAVRATALHALADLCRKPTPWDGKWWNTQPAKSAPPAHTIDWELTSEIENAVRARLGDPLPVLRAAALEAVRDTHDDGALPEVRARYVLEPIQSNRRLALDVIAALRDEGARDFLAAIVHDPAASRTLREHAVETACAIGTPAMVDLLCSVASDESAPPEESAPCMRALGKLKEKRASALLVRRAASGAEEARAAAISALVEIDGASSLPTIEPFLADASAVVRRAAIRAYGTLPIQAAPLLLPLVHDEATRDDAIEALAHEPDPRALSAYLMGVSSATKSVREASLRALGVVRAAVRADVDALVEQNALDVTTIAILRSIYSEPEPILGWKLLGPFARDASQPRVASMNAAHPADAANATSTALSTSTPRTDGAQSPSGGEPLVIDASHLDPKLRARGLGGADVTWIDASAEPVNGFIDLEKAIARQSNAAVFAWCEIASTREREAEMSAGSDDTLSVWVNGELVHDFDGNRSWRADEDRFKVKLRAGSNAVLLRIGNGSGQWSFNAKISADPSGPLFENGAKAPAIADYRAFALANGGDPARGYKLFREHAGLMCIRCHTINGAGAQVGPDLSDVALKYSKEDIITSVLEPSVRIADGYKTATFEMRSGVMLSGLVKSENKDEVILYDPSGEEKRIEKADVQSRTESKLSLMPAGQASLLTKEEFADLIAYLTTLRGSPGKRP
jgi:putative membrane-bound dehydrogenase-like protein